MADPERGLPVGVLARDARGRVEFGITLKMTNTSTEIWCPATMPPPDDESDHQCSQPVRAASGRARPHQPVAEHTLVKNTMMAIIRPGTIVRCGGVDGLVPVGDHRAPRHSTDLAGCNTTDSKSAVVGDVEREAMIVEMMLGSKLKA